ncbi:MAG: hypothetical protein RI897_2726 [Verrucomicrobiota bacterium]
MDFEVEQLAGLRGGEQFDLAGDACEGAVGEVDLFHGGPGGELAEGF